MFMNYMDYSDDRVMNMFTIGQKKRMRALFASGNMRNSFLTAFACDSTLAQGGPLPGPDETVPVAGIKPVKIYPNPFHSSVTIENNTAEKLSGKSIKIFNVMGINVFSGILNTSKNSIDLSSLATGVFFVEVGEGSEKYTTRIVHQ